MSAAPSQLFKFVKPVFLAIIPGMSESIDTMKDWVVTGMCFMLASQSPTSLLDSAKFITVLILADAILIRYMMDWVNEQWRRGRRDQKEKIPIATRLPLTWLLVAVLSLPVMVAASSIDAYGFFDERMSCPASCETQKFLCVGFTVYSFLEIIACYIAVTFALGPQGEGEGCFCMIAVLLFIIPQCVCIRYFGCLTDWYWGLWMWYKAVFSSDGVALGIFSAYVILGSNVVLYQASSFTSDLRKSCFSVLSLPTTPEKPKNCRQWLQATSVKLTAELTSDARLANAWNEDWPQGFLGLFLVWKLGAVSGFAFFSGGLSLVKGLAIPAIRALLVASHWYSLHAACKALTTEMATELEDVNAWNQRMWSPDKAIARGAFLRHVLDQEKVSDRIAEKRSESSNEDDLYKRCKEFVTLAQLDDEIARTSWKSMVSVDLAILQQRLVDMGASGDVFIEVAEAVRRKTTKDKLQQRLVVFFDTKYEMFSDIIADANQACESDITKCVHVAVFASMVSYLKNQDLRESSSRMSAWTRCLSTRAR
eukprot:TRINITY_DN25897_c1_g4_i1.p1 TRINITY_DN25897_c1_g4~~TRINITY_DN25897_c1_g4_i1.p1  ORF type:complete len:567 (+),score=55.29 TRINITY_DN25897_c1_g4_i1:92-1702(+)